MCEICSVKSSFASDESTGTIGGAESPSESSGGRGWGEVHVTGLKAFDKMACERWRCLARLLASSTVRQVARSATGAFR